MYRWPHATYKACTGLVVQAVTRGVKANLLVDTGATDKVLSSELYYQITNESRPKLTTIGAEIHNADGNKMETLGSAWIEIQVGRTTCPVHAVFGNTGQTKGILEIDLLLPTQGTLDFQTLELKLNGKKIRCTDTKGADSVRGWSLVKR